LSFLEPTNLLLLMAFPALLVAGLLNPPASAGSVTVRWWLLKTAAQSSSLAA
jgi:hypothetical protein